VQRGNRHDLFYLRLVLIGADERQQVIFRDGIDFIDGQNNRLAGVRQTVENRQIGRQWGGRLDHHELHVRFLHRLKRRAHERLLQAVMRF